MTYLTSRIKNCQKTIKGDHIKDGTEQRLNHFKVVGPNYFNFGYDGHLLIGYLCEGLGHNIDFVRKIYNKVIFM